MAGAVGAGLLSPGIKMQERKAQELLWRDHEGLNRLRVSKSVLTHALSAAILILQKPKGFARRTDPTEQPHH